MKPYEESDVKHTMNAFFLTWELCLLSIVIITCFQECHQVSKQIVPDIFPGEFFWPDFTKAITALLNIATVAFFFPLRST